MLCMLANLSMINLDNYYCKKIHNTVKTEIA